MWGRPDEPQVAALVEARHRGARAASDGHPADLARELVDGLRGGDVVWVGSSDGDPGLSDAIAVEVTRLPEPPDVELLIASFDVPGARLLDVVAVMDRLRSPGGCPWDAEQTHASPRALPARGGPRGHRGDRERRPRAHAGGARRPAAPDRLPGPRRPGAPEPSRSTSTTSPAASSTSSSAVTPTSSPTSRPTPPTRWPPTGRRSRPPRSSTGPTRSRASRLAAGPRPGREVRRRGCTGPAGTTSSTRPSRRATSAPSCWTSSAGPGRGRRRRSRPARDAAAAGAALSRDRRSRGPTDLLSPDVAPPRGAAPPLRPGARQGASPAHSAGGVPGAPGPRADARDEVPAPTPFRGPSQYAPCEAKTAWTVRARIARSWTIDQLST